MRRDQIALQIDWQDASPDLVALSKFSCQPMINLACTHYGAVAETLLAKAVSDVDSRPDERAKMGSLFKALATVRILDDLYEESDPNQTQQIAVEVYACLRLLGHSPENASWGLLAALMKKAFHAHLSDEDIGERRKEMLHHFGPHITGAVFNLGLFGRTFLKNGVLGNHEMDTYIDAIGRPMRGSRQGTLVSRTLPLMITLIDLHHGELAGHVMDNPVRMGLYRGLLARRIDDCRFRPMLPVCALQTFAFGYRAEEGQRIQTPSVPG